MIIDFSNSLSLSQSVLYSLNQKGSLGQTKKMGLFDRLANLLGLRRKEVNVLVVGLNNSGKSTVINHFKREEDRCLDIVPTVGFNVEKFACKFFLS